MAAWYCMPSSGGADCPWYGFGLPDWSGGGGAESCACATIGVMTKAAASAAVAIDFLERLFLERRGDAMFLPACPPSFVRHICRATGLRGELGSSSSRAGSPWSSAHL